MRPFLAVFLSCVLLNTDPSRAEDYLLQDFVVLNSGARLMGKVTEMDVDGKKFVVVEMENGMTLKVRRTSVSQLRLAETRLAEYQALLAKSTDDVEGHWNLAAWCKKNLESGSGSGRLSPQREFHLRKVIRLDPKHVDAHKLLGYRQIDGQWIQRNHLASQHGMVRRGSRWYTPQELLIEELNEKADAKYGWWRSELKKQRSRSNKLAEYKRTLATVDSKFAATGLIERFRNEKDPQLRSMTLDAIGRLDSSRSRNFLVDTAIMGATENERDRALSLLNGKQFSKSHASNRAVSILNQTKDNKVVNRAGYVIGQLRQESAIYPLIQSLRTTHEYIVGPDGNMAMQFSNGGIGFSPGQKKKKVKINRENDGVLSSLRIISGENFDFDQPAWIRWYIAKYTVGHTDLRREK